jgi:hypothetical protein
MSLVVMFSVWFGFIARLSQGVKGGGGFNCSNSFYLPRRWLQKGEAAPCDLLTRIYVRVQCTGRTIHMRAYVPNPVNLLKA